MMKFAEGGNMVRVVVMGKNEGEARRLRLFEMVIC